MESDFDSSSMGTTFNNYTNYRYLEPGPVVCSGSNGAAQIAGSSQLINIILNINKYPFGKVAIIHTLNKQKQCLLIKISKLTTQT